MWYCAECGTTFAKEARADAYRCLGDECPPIATRMLESLPKRDRVTGELVEIVFVRFEPEKHEMRARIYWRDREPTLVRVTDAD